MRFHLLRLGCLLAAACGLCLLAGQPEVLAQVKAKKEQAVDVKGEPKGFKAGDTVRYAVWASKKGWHVRTTTAKKLHYFSGKIHVEGGTIIGLEPHDLEYKGRFGDWWKLNEKRQEIVIDFKTDRGMDGINFQVSPEAKMIHFNLWIDGKHQPKLIYVGKDSYHPPSDPFITAAHPKK